MCQKGSSGIRFIRNVLIRIFESTGCLRSEKVKKLYDRKAKTMYPPNEIYWTSKDRLSFDCLSSSCKYYMYVQNNSKLKIDNQHLRNDLMTNRIFMLALQSYDKNTFLSCKKTLSGDFLFSKYRENTLQIFNIPF